VLVSWGKRPGHKRRAKLPFGEALNLIDHLMKHNLVRLILRQSPVASDIGERGVMKNHQRGVLLLRIVLVVGKKPLNGKPRRKGLGGGFGRSLMFNDVNKNLNKQIARAVVVMLRFFKPIDGAPRMPTEVNCVVAFVFHPSDLNIWAGIARRRRASRFLLMILSHVAALNSQLSPLSEGLVPATAEITPGDASRAA
jgi:hypothetical protein